MHRKIFSGTKFLPNCLSIQVFRKEAYRLHYLLHAWLSQGRSPSDILSILKLSLLDGHINMMHQNSYKTSASGLWNAGEKLQLRDTKKSLRSKFLLHKVVKVSWKFEIQLQRGQTIVSCSTFFQYLPTEFYEEDKELK